MGPAAEGGSGFGPGGPRHGHADCRHGGQGTTPPMAGQAGTASLLSAVVAFHFAMPVSIRSRLLLLVLAVLLPGMLGVAWLIGSTYEAERDAHERTLRDTARALSLLVDGELQRRATIAHILSQSPLLDAPELDGERRIAFERTARRAMQGMDGWVELRAPGRVLLNTRLPDGAGEQAGAAQLLATPLMQPLMTLASDARQHYAAWVEPVRRDGQLLYNLVVTVRPSELQRIVQAQVPHSGWIGSVMDSAGRIVARQPGGGDYVGRQARAELMTSMSHGAEGPFESQSLDGEAAAGYFSTSPLGWSFVTAMPREEFAGRLPQAVLRVGVGALLLLALAMAGAVWVAGRIVRPILMLKTAAEDLQVGRPVPAAPSTGILEFDEVAEALTSASHAQAHARGDLEHSVAEAVQRTRVVEQRGAQSQRVEALGRLTGGVAHEFNNLLGVISNSMHLVRRHPASSELQGPLNATQRAIDRGSALTQHLLRFAGRRPVKVQNLSLADYLPEVQELVSSVLGRRVDMTLQVAPGTRPVRVDASELDLALVNLALNAHDAMPNGGHLRIRAGNASAEDTEGLPPGDYVLLTVGDDGVGLSPALVEHAFEPFFTTKGVGQGSGLGLSQVHGFATQAGGAARLASTPGVGTTVSLLLPVADAAASSPVPALADTAHQNVKDATVLLVEDDEALGDVTAELLTAHGARVLRAHQAEGALRLLDAGARVDVVLSDIVMPGPLDGVALARRLRLQRPGLPVVLITGFSPNALAEDEFIQLGKPCTPAVMLATLHAAITGSRSTLGQAAS